MNTKKKIIISILSLVVILGFGTTLAYLRSDAGSNNNNSLTVADFHVDLITDITNVNMSSMYPMSDSEGLANDKVTFAIKNNGDVLANYKVSLIDKDIVSTLPNSDVRYQLKRKIGNNQQETFEISNLDLNGLIDSGSIDVGVTITYELVMWQDYNSTANGATFSKSILVEGMQSANLDTSGANFPELLENMIPVYYEATSDTVGVWKKADSTNRDSTYKWFDYNSQMWANAVTVKETGTNTREYYLGASNGTEISMDDITSMWVWIPRYKYVIFNGNNETSNEQMINVIFEHGKDKTGTVTCVDNIQSSANSTSSEICTDTINGSIVNHKSTYTHPAFTFASEELTGFWIGKFEMSTDDSTCNETPSDTNCNKQGLNILVKPNVSSLRYENVSTMFANIRRMEIYGNIHGFSQSKNTTTWLNSSNNLTGEIANDSNNFDTHMIKNMEWGAVSYLSESKYGKYGNSLYTGAYKEVYINNNNSSKTGYSGGSFDSNGSNSNTYLYNNLTNQGNGKGYLGAGASTTGNVYGAYDMNGGSFEYVMLNMVNTSGKFYSSDSQIWTESIYPNSNYYDIYSFTNNNNILTSKLGDAIKEVNTNSSSTVGKWYGDYNVFTKNDKPWIYRGGYYSNGSTAGIFYSSSATGVYRNLDSSRPVLTITREMPWLNN